MLGSNQRQSACKTGALPTELIAYNLVGRDGVEPSQPQAADLQSVELTNAQPPLNLFSLFTYIVPCFGGKSQGFIQVFLWYGGG